MSVNWNEPIEAVHADGRVVAASRFRNGEVWPDPSGQYHVKADPGFSLMFFEPDGTPWNGYSFVEGWRIRNVAPATNADTVEEWGPKLAISRGEMPSWLSGKDRIKWIKNDGAENREGGPCTASEHNWGRYINSPHKATETIAIRLPANHPHYAKPVRTAAEQLDRMEALVRSMANDEARDYPAEARAIVALLPEPVDPDLVEARKICEERVRLVDANLAAEYRDGDYDTQMEMQVTLAAIKRGRQLEREGK